MENWIDDLPICKHSGVGFQTNQKYKAGGSRRELHEREDRSFHVKFPSSDVSLYGVFDGHESAYVAHFASQKIPAELLLDVEIADSSEKVVNLALKNAFDSVEKGYLALINEILVKRTNLQLQIPEALNSYEVCLKYPGLVYRLQELDREIQGGASATVALLQGKSLYVANLGDSRALLCTKDADGSLHVEQLSMDHTVTNAQELQRLANLGLDIEKIQQQGRIDHLETTRSLGDFRAKGGYKDVDFLRIATDEPVTAEPFINGGIPVDASFYFLAIFTRGFYKTLEEINASSQVNKDIIALIAAELNDQSTIEAVAQSVVDKLCRAHQEEFARSLGAHCQEREDMTLLIRLFSANLGRRSTPVTPPISVSIKHAQRTSPKPPPAMHVSVPFVVDDAPSLETVFDRLPRLIMPCDRLGLGRFGSFSQPNSRVCSPVTLAKTAATPPGILYRNLSNLSEGSSLNERTPSSSSTIETTPLGSAKMTPSSDSSSHCSSSQMSLTIRAATIQPLPPPADTPLPGLSNRDPTDSRVDDACHSDTKDNDDDDATGPIEERPPSPDDGKVEPYINFAEFFQRINKEGGEAVVFAEFFM